MKSTNQTYIPTPKDIIIAKRAAVTKGFTGQALCGGVEDTRYDREYEETPYVNKGMLQAARKLDYDNNPKAVNFILFHDCKLNDDDMYWLTSMFNTHKSSLAVNTIDLSNNCIRLEKDNGLPFFSSIPKNVLKLDLSNNNIGDYGAKVIAEGFANGLLPITKFLNLGGNKITTSGFQYLKDSIKGINQEIAIITETKYDTGKAIIKDSKSEFYEMSIKSDGKEDVFEFADGITGISGISAGENCPPSIKEQIGACLGGGVGALTATWTVCKGSGKEKLVCVGKSFLTGCVSNVMATTTTQCVSGKEYEHHFKDNDKDWGFTVDGGTEIKGTYIDNSRGAMGSAFDLSEHDF